MKRLIQLASSVIASCFHVFARHRIATELAGTGIDSPVLGGFPSKSTPSAPLAETKRRRAPSASRAFASLDSSPSLPLIGVL